MAVQRYRVQERIAVGGMAEVFKGVATSLRGFEKIVAIKRVLPHLTRNRTFVRMFLDEARLSLHLNHANVAQVFDVGHADDAYFIVMEFIEGLDLGELMDVARYNDLLLPYEQAVYILSEVCKGLAYAHDKRDPKGEHLRIVHRDISPPNVLISMQGEIKIVDFGLAKARSQLETTDPGLVKGKFGYLSPEAAMGEEIDARTDIFAVGIVLWEMLAGKRLFLGRNDQETLELVRRARVPALREHNPEVPERLERIVRKALARDPAERYGRADALGKELAQFLFTSDRKVTSYDIAALVQAAVQHVEREPPAPPLDDALDRFIEEELKLSSLDHDPIFSDDGIVKPELALSEPEIEVEVEAEEERLENPSDWFDEPLFDGSINLNLAQIVGPDLGRVKAPSQTEEDEAEGFDIDVDFEHDGAEHTEASERERDPDVQDVPQLEVPVEEPPARDVVEPAVPSAAAAPTSKGQPPWLWMALGVMGVTVVLIVVWLM